MTRATLPTPLATLGPRVWLLLIALLRSRSTGARFAPRLELTIALLEELESCELIEVAWAGFAGAAASPDASAHLHWRLRGDLGPGQRLTGALTARLAAAPGPTFQQVCLPLWHALVEAEAMAHLAHRLRRRGWEAHWSRDLAYVAAQLPAPPSVLHWRGCVRAALRDAARLGDPGVPPEARREGIYQSLQWRAMAPAITPRDCPSRRWPVPATALADAVVRFASLGAHYWTAAPTAESFEGRTG